jgi:hypothetical protein
VIDIHKKVVAAKLLREPIMQPTGHADRIVSAVIDENLTNHYRSPRGSPQLYRRTGRSTMILLTLADVRF